MSATTTCADLSSYLGNRTPMLTETAGFACLLSRLLVFQRSGHVRRDLWRKLRRLECKTLYLSLAQSLKPETLNL